MTPPTNQDSAQSTVNNVWGSTTPEGTTIFLTCPSGQTCHATRLGLPGMVKAGVLGEADSLTSFVDKKHIRRVRGGNGAPDAEEINMASIMKDPDALGKILMMVDRTLPLVVTNPVVRKHFTDEEDGTTLRVPDDSREVAEPGQVPIVYTDQIGLEDKMYLFNWTVGGTGDADRFSDESGSYMATVEHGEGVSRQARRAARPRKNKR